MKTILAVAAVVLLTGCAYQHQEVAPAPSTMRDPRSAALARADRGSTLRLFLPNERLQGTILRLDSTTLTVDVRGLPVSIRIGDIDSIFIHRSNVGKGAVIGAIPLAAVGAFFGFLLSGLCEYDCHPAQATVGVGLLGAAVGGSVGGLVGLAASGWRPLYVPRASSP
jgi:hypothetical protein